MIMSSIGFLYFFLPLFMGLYAVVSKKHRAKLILLGELVFVGWGSVYALIPLVSSMLLAYLLGMMTDNRRNNKAGQKKILLAAVFSQLIIIILAVLSSFGMLPNGVARAFPPVGAFVYTLNSMSYCLDIYKGKNRCDHRFTLVAAYVGFFPCITAGPLLRYDDFFPQLEAPDITADKLSRGISLYLKGLAERCVLSLGVFHMWQQLTQLNLDDVSAITAWLGIIAAGMYVYFEFASISHMARGISLMLGIELPVNFDHPFAVRSMNELVRKFNVSVTAWFTDYVYRPLTGSSKSRARTVCAAVLTGTAMALWYGAKLPKLIFGAYIGLVCGTELILHKKSEKKLAYIPSMVITMGLLHLGLVLFICDDIVYALKYIPVMFGKNGMLIDNLTLYFFQNFFVLMLIGVFITSGLAKHLYEKLERSRRTFLPFLRPLSQLVLLVISTAFMSGAKQEYLGLFFN